MPIYEFKCDDCGKVFETLCFRSGDGDAVECPKCGGKKAEKLLSSFCSVGSGSDSDAATASAGGCAPRGGFS